MMSRRDALRSYRRQFKRAYAHVAWLAPRNYKSPAMVELGKRGDRLKAVWCRTNKVHPYKMPYSSEVSVEVLDAMTSADIAYCADPKNDEELPW